MATPAQAAAATVGAGSLAAAGAYGITQAVTGSEGEETTEEQNTDESDIPSTVETFDNDSVSASPYTGKLITFIKQSNLSFIVKPSDTKWWDWAFTNKFEKLKNGKNFHTVFNNLTSPEALKTACQNAYTQNKDQYKFGEQDYLLDNISDFCTKTKNRVDISEPKAQVYNGAQKASGYENGILSIAENAAVLVKKETDNDNDLWWKWAYAKLYKPNNTEVATIFSSTTLTQETETSGTNALNTACEDSYKKGYQDLTTDNNKLLNNIKQFCSTNRTFEFKLPEPASPTKLTNSSSNYTSVKFVQKNLDKLIDPDSTGNQNWWTWAFNSIYQLETNKEGLPKPFKKVSQAYDATANGTSVENPTSLNKACKKAYSENKTNIATLLSTIKKFCAPSSTSELSVQDSD